MLCVKGLLYKIHVYVNIYLQYYVLWEYLRNQLHSHTSCCIQQTWLHKMIQTFCCEQFDPKFYTIAKENSFKNIWVATDFEHTKPSANSVLVCSL